MDNTGQIVQMTKKTELLLLHSCATHKVSLPLAVTSYVETENIKCVSAKMYSCIFLCFHYISASEHRVFKASMESVFCDFLCVFDIDSRSEE